MKYNSEIKLRNGDTLLLRSLHAGDAQAAVLVGKRTAGETLNMMRYEDEWIITPEKEREILYEIENAPKALMLGAFLDNRLVGMASLRPVHPGDRARHRAAIGISILKAYWGQGIGTAMMQALIAAAKTTPLEQLELDVVSTNETAIRLYQRVGFVEYGRHPRTMKYRDGSYADTILMMLDLRRGS